MHMKSRAFFSILYCMRIGTISIILQFRWKNHKEWVNEKMPMNKVISMLEECSFEHICLCNYRVCFDACSRYFWFVCVCWISIGLYGLHRLKLVACVCVCGTELHSCFYMRTIYTWRKIFSISVVIRIFSGQTLSSYLLWDSVHCVQWISTMTTIREVNIDCFYMCLLTVRVEWENSIRIVWLLKYFACIFPPYHNGNDSLETIQSEYFDYISSIKSATQNSFIIQPMLKKRNNHRKNGFFIHIFSSFSNHSKWKHNKYIGW